MALSVGQVNDAYAAALGRAPTGAEISAVDPSLEGDSGKFQLISQLQGKGGVSSNSNTNFTGIQNPVQTAQQLLQFQQQANAPVIGSLSAQIPDIESRYNDLLTSIKGQGTVAGNYAQQAESMDLGNRGLLPQSQEGQFAISNALLPVTQATSGALAQAGIGEQSDINQVNQAIAALQSGQTSTAVQGGLSLYNTQQQMATQLALGSLSNLFKEFGLGGGVVNTQTGNLVGGGGGGNGFSLSGNTPAVTPQTVSTPTTTNTATTPTSNSNVANAVALNPFLGSISKAQGGGGFLPLTGSLNFNQNQNKNKNPNGLFLAQ